MLVNLLGLAVLHQKPAEDALAAHPDDLLRQTSVLGTMALTVASVPALALGSVLPADAGARVDSFGLPDDEAVLLKLADVLAFTVSNSFRKSDYGSWPWKSH